MRLAEVPYRARQLFHALFPRLHDAHIEGARSLLGEGETRLFLSMEKRDQSHGMRAMQHLKDQGQSDRDLLAAALLHDCGKGRVPVALRVLYVLAPWAVEAFGASGAQAAGLRGACHRLVNHAALGAALARHAGASDATVRLIEGRAAEHERDKIRMLRAADDHS